jgi:hypothetical protein
MVYSFTYYFGFIQCYFYIYIYIYNFYFDVHSFKVKFLMFYDVQTINLAFVGKT